MRLSYHLTLNVRPTEWEDCIPGQSQSWTIYQDEWTVEDGNAPIETSKQVYDGPFSSVTEAVARQRAYLAQLPATYF